MDGFRRSRRAAAALSLVWLAACASGPSRDSADSFRPLAVSLPQGIKAGLWNERLGAVVVATQVDGHNQLAISVVDVAEERAVTRAFPAHRADAVRPALAADGEGRTWVAWGRQLAHVGDSGALGAPVEIPQPLNAGGASAGAAVTLSSAGGVLYVAQLGSTSLQRFDTASRTWLAPWVTGLLPSFSTRLLFAGGSVFENGRDPSGAWKLVRLDLGTGLSSPVEGVAPTAVFLDGSRLGLVEAGGAVQVYDPGSRATSRARATVPDAALEVLAAERGTTGLLFARGATGFRVVRLLPGSEAVESAFPAVSGMTGEHPGLMPDRAGPSGVYDPQVQAVVPVGSAGTLVLTRSGQGSAGTLGSYAPAYLLS